MKETNELQRNVEHSESPFLVPRETGGPENLVRLVSRQNYYTLHRRLLRTFGGCTPVHPQHAVVHIPFELVLDDFTYFNDA